MDTIDTKYVFFFFVFLFSFMLCIFFVFVLLYNIYNAMLFINNAHIHDAGCKLNTHSHILLLIYCIFASTENWMSILSSCCYQFHWLNCVHFVQRIYNAFYCNFLFFFFFGMTLTISCENIYFLFAFQFNDDDKIKRILYLVFGMRIINCFLLQNPFYLSKINEWLLNVC